MLVAGRGPCKVRIALQEPLVLSSRIIHLSCIIGQHSTESTSYRPSGTWDGSLILGSFRQMIHFWQVQFASCLRLAKLQQNQAVNER